WSAPFVAQTQVEGQLRADFPVVLKEEGRLFVLIFHRCEGSQEAVARIAGSQQNIGEGISLRVISTVDCLLGHRRREIEIARGWGCQKLLKKILCSPPNFQMCRPRTQVSAEL